MIETAPARFSLALDPWECASAANLTLSKKEALVLELLKEPETFKVWLKEKEVDSNTVVGIRGDAAHCPIATFLGQFGLSSKVHPDAIVTFEPHEENIPTGWLDTKQIGYWVEEFIEDIDNLFLDEVTANAALEVLDNITEGARVIF